MAGETIVEKDISFNDALYIVGKGRAYQIGRNAKQPLIGNVLRKGDIFGDDVAMVLVDETLCRRNYTVRALTYTQTYKLATSNWLNLIQSGAYDTLKKFVRLYGAWLVVQYNTCKGALKLLADLQNHTEASSKPRSIDELAEQNSTMEETEENQEDEENEAVASNRLAKAELAQEAWRKFKIAQVLSRRTMLGVHADSNRVMLKEAHRSGLLKSEAAVAGDVISAITSRPLLAPGAAGSAHTDSSISERLDKLLILVDSVAKTQERQQDKLDNHTRLLQQSRQNQPEPLPPISSPLRGTTAAYE
jgi:hypothetical protein